MIVLEFRQSTVDHQGHDGRAASGECRMPPRHRGATSLSITMRINQLDPNQSMRRSVQKLWKNVDELRFFVRNCSAPDL